MAGAAAVGTGTDTVGTAITGVIGTGAVIMDGTATTIVDIVAATDTTVVRRFARSMETITGTAQRTIAQVLGRATAEWQDSRADRTIADRKSTRLNSSHMSISYA